MAYRAQVVCRGCGVAFETHQKSRLFCCDKCRFAYNFAKTGYCLLCRANVPIEYAIGLYRSEPGTPLGDFPAQHVACRVTYLEKAGRDDSCRCADCKRRKEIVTPLPTKGKRRATFHDKHRQEVLEADDYICQICGLPTDPDASPSSELYPTLDHIVRVSDGGDDDIDNLRTAHKWCNTTLSASPFGEAYVRERAHLRFGSKPAGGLEPA